MQLLAAGYSSLPASEPSHCYVHSHGVIAAVVTEFTMVLQHMMDSAGCASFDFFNRFSYIYWMNAYLPFSPRNRQVNILNLMSSFILFE